MMIPNLFNEKVAVRQVEEEIKGSIVLPQNRVLKFEMGEVIATGDGKYRDGTSQKMWVKAGDTVMYQLGGPQIQNSKFKLNGVPIKIFHQGDVIGKLTAKTVTKDTFKVIGNWVLLEVKMETGVIIVPEKIAPSEDFTFVVAQIGENVVHPLSIGQRVYPERGRCLPIEIDGVTYVYTHQDFLQGALVEGGELEDAVPTPA